MPLFSHFWINGERAREVGLASLRRRHLGLRLGIARAPNQPAQIRQLRVSGNDIRDLSCLIEAALTQATRVQGYRDNGAWVGRRVGIEGFDLLRQASAKGSADIFAVVEFKIAD
jgi:hypothetical protein